MIQPPRGFGENPVAIYHDPDMAPSHHYLAAYRWLEASPRRGRVRRARRRTPRASTARWSGCRARASGWRPDCAPDAVLGNLPLVYPFIVNDPGEGTQAKRRAHAIVVDHLVPPMARAETYGDMAKLEYLLDEYATVSALDPEKVPTLRAQIWTLIQAAQLHHDLHTSEKPEDDDVRRVRAAPRRVPVRDQGRADPRRAAHPRRRRRPVRRGSTWCSPYCALGRCGVVRTRSTGLRAALGETFGVDEAELLADPGRVVPELADLATLADLPAVSGADGVDLLEAVARKLVVGMETLSWDAAKVPVVVDEVLGRTSAGRSRLR